MRAVRAMRFALDADETQMLSDIASAHGSGIYGVYISRLELDFSRYNLVDTSYLFSQEGCVVGNDEMSYIKGIYWGLNHSGIRGIEAILTGRNNVVEYTTSAS